MATKELAAHVALLRGVNVGGKNKLPMKDLAALFERLGCADVRTYIQSGNVVFTASAPLARRLPALAAEAILERFGLTVPVVIRSADELRALVDRSPFLRAGADPAHLHVMFLADAPGPRLVAALDPDRSPPDEFRVLGRDVHLRCPGGVARSKLTTAWFDRALETTSTARNWNTVLKLIELVGQG